MKNRLRLSSKSFSHRDSSPPYARLSSLSQREVPSLASGDLIHPPENAYKDPTFLLQDSIDVLRDRTGSPKQRAKVKEVVEQDAARLAKQLIEAEEPPTLNETLLLARAYDVTRDSAIASALGYILNNTPPPLSEELCLAFNRAGQKNTPIMFEYGNAIVEREQRTTPKPSRAEMAFILDMRRASSPQGSRPQGHDSRKDDTQTGVFSN